MISPDDKKLLGELGRNQFGGALKRFLTEELKSIDTVKGVKSLDEALGRERAVVLIEKLFSFLEEKKQPTKTPHPYE